MPGFWSDEYPTPERLAMVRAWKAHYIAKGCNLHKAFWLAQKKTHTWPNGERR
jgi:hypothetical protein